MRVAARFLSPAEEEMLEAAAYDGARSKGLGRDFLRETYRAVADIEESPKRWPETCSGIRRRLVHRYPYAILYKTNDSEISIVAVMHLRRRPDYWIGRLRACPKR